MPFLLHSNSFLIMGAARVGTCRYTPLSGTRLMAMGSGNLKKSPAATEGGLEGRTAGQKSNGRQLVFFCCAVTKNSDLRNWLRQLRRGKQKKPPSAYARFSAVSRPSHFAAPGLTN